MSTNQENQAHYVINKLGSYFTVVGKLDNKYMSDCDFYPSLEALCAAVSEATGAPASEVKPNVYTFSKDPELTDYPWHMRGFNHTAKQGTRLFTEFTIEYYLSKWSL
ncbi:hypothetical protein [Vibrio crassostreae]|uniref:hypothetical protein n=1 Tax=Vibrio crassostreae TaxID=246167 RepID=UPI001B3054BE|nr:hypothetical protein [Vibrio crassostreae]